jgi:hypothetical protein
MVLNNYFNPYYFQASKSYGLFVRKNIIPTVNVNYGCILTDSGHGGADDDNKITIIIIIIIIILI